MTKLIEADEFAASVKGQPGEQPAPAGSPLTDTETGPENPFEPVTETVTGAVVVPTSASIDVAETESAKSAAGLAPAFDPPTAPLPQPRKTDTAAAQTPKAGESARCCCMIGPPT